MTELAVTRHRGESNYDTASLMLVVLRRALLMSRAICFVNECDFAICSASATLFDPHANSVWVSVLEPMCMLALSVPYREVMRWALLASEERLSAERRPQGIQGTVRAMWEARDRPRTTAGRSGRLTRQQRSARGSGDPTLVASRLDDDAVRERHEDGEEHHEGHTPHDQLGGFGPQGGVRRRRKEESCGHVLHAGPLVVVTVRHGDVPSTHGI
jgi:hypothetical protein